MISEEATTRRDGKEKRGDIRAHHYPLIVSVGVAVGVWMRVRG